MQIKRLFDPDSFKGTEGYLNSQKKFEVIRTVIYFAISISLFIVGWVTTKTKVNLLTIVAVLGCLPASKSAVQMIMYLRYRSLSKEACETIRTHAEGLTSLYDLVFTSYDRNYSVGHMVIKGNTLIGYTEDKKFAEKAFYTHLDQILKKDRITGVSIKIFCDQRKYMERLLQLKELETDESSTENIIRTLKSVSL